MKTQSFVGTHLLRGVVLIILLGLLNTPVLEAAISGVSLAVSPSEGSLTSDFNGGINVTLTANWTQGDTPPFAATFQKGGVDFKSTTVSGPPATVNVSGTELGGGAHSFAVRVIETSVAGATPQTAGGGSINIDVTPPGFSNVELSKTTLSRVAPNNTTTLRITTDEPLLAAPTVTVSPSTGITVGAAVPGSAGGSYYQYEISVGNDAAGGAYSVNISAKDNTLPSASANTNSTTKSFEVQVTGPSAPTIGFTDTTLSSPTKRTFFTLGGDAGATVVSVEVFDGTTSVGTANVSGGKWSVGITSTEGRHTYTVKGTDNLGNVGVGSGNFEVVVDTTPPTQPLLVQPISPTSLDKISVTGTNASDPVSASVNAPPVNVTLYKSDGTAIKSVNANLDGTFSFSDIPLDVGENMFFARGEDQAKGSRGNESGNSAFIRVVRDTAGGAVGSLLISRATPVLASQPVPMPGTTWICPGNYDVTVNFNEDMATDTNPTIGYTPQNGTEITNNTGTWASPTVFVGKIMIPAGQGAATDGNASIRIFGAKDSAGNTMVEYNQGNALHIDTRAPVTTLASQSETLYIGSGTTTVVMSGTSVDRFDVECSGVGYVLLSWQLFDDPTAVVASQNIPIMNGDTADFSYTWDVTGIAPGKYKVWGIGGDRAQPSPNVEVRDTGKYRTMIKDQIAPTSITVHFDDESADMNAAGVPVVASDVVKLAAKFAEEGTGIDFARVSTLTFVLTHPAGTVVDGNFSNNGTNIINFNFPVLTDPGTYTVSVTLWDLAGNQGGPATRSFQIDRSGPIGVSFQPTSGRYVNKTNPAVGRDEVWATIDETPPIDYLVTSSTFEVTYNGINAGTQIASQDQLVSNLWADLPGRVATDQSVDGKYDMVVTPIDNYGNIGAAQKSHFWLDTQPPAISKSDPVVDSWFGLAPQPITTSFSDAPRDQTTFHGAQICGDGSWYSGLGSGLNLGAASYSAGIIDGASYTAYFSGSAVSTNSIGITFQGLSIPYTNATETPGVATISVLMSVPDRVNDLTPNVRTATHSYYYDYVRPNFTFTKPLTNRKYCQPQLEMEGATYEWAPAPFSSMTQIIKAEVSHDNANWGSVNTTPALPTASVTWKVVADISAVAEGSRTFYGRSFDRGNNMSHPTDPGAAEGSPTTITITIDRTPPAPPTLVLPLNDAIVNARGNLHRWSKPTDASRYLFQVSDTQGFTNILNNTATTSTVLTGMVTNTNQASFAATKDGTYYWRVASIEDCEDGYNISSFSAVFRYHIDTVKPKVLEVQPTPSTGNKVTTGMVTFTIRFSEKMDVTKIPTVSVTSAGGQYMLIEQVKFVDNTWTGTTVIPKDNSALYDGNAVISIANAYDLAGNQMETDSTNNIIINTGPAFETKIFSNPAHEYEIVIVTRSTEGLQGPPVCTVTQNGAKVPVTMNFLKEKYYAGSYRIDAAVAGTAYIDISGTDLYGMTGRGSVEFTIAGVNPSVRTFLRLADKTSSVDIPQGAVSKPINMFVVPRALVEQPNQSEASARVAAVAGGLLKTRNVVLNPELKEVMALDEIGPLSVKLQKSAWYRASVKNLNTSIPLEKIHLYRQDGTKWVYCGGSIQDGQLLAPITGFGRLALMADLKAPVLTRISPSDREKLDDPLPLFEGSFADEGSGVWKDSLVLTIDGQPQTGVEIDESGNFTFQVKKPLARGSHQVEVAVADRAGNTLKQAFSVVAPGPFAIDELQAYPNPARGPNVHITYNLQQKADDIRLKVFDTSGAKVAEFDNFNFAARSSGKITWDLTNADGRKVSNGVYFFKMEAVKNGQKHKASRKLAVLR
jgi:flagellar hook assembly protein FlgD